MTVLTIRTENPETEIGLYEDSKEIGYVKWEAHRKLTDTIHLKVKEILNQSSIGVDDLGGIVVFKGPGSFTGLRIGISVANSLAYALSIPIVAKTGSNWIENGIKDLESGKNDKIVLPKYGQPPNITTPKSR